MKYAVVMSLGATTLAMLLTAAVILDSRTTSRRHLIERQEADTLIAHLEERLAAKDARLAESERAVETWVGIAQARAEERDAAIFEIGYMQARLEDEECGPAQLFTYPAEGMLLHFVDICFLGLKLIEATPEDIDSPFEKWRDSPAPEGMEGSIVR